MSKRGNAFMLLLMLYNIVVSMALTLIYVWLADTPFAGFVMTPWFLIINEVICFLLPLSLWLMATRTGLNECLPNIKLGRVNIILVLALCLCLQPAMMMLSALSSLVFPNDVSGLLTDIQRYPLAVSLAAVAVTPALCEEIIFRGYILSQYNKVSIKKAALINGLFFAVMHLNAQQFLYAFFMGIVFAYFVYYTRSIRAGVLAHFTVNASQLLLSRALDSAGTTGTVAYDPNALWTSLLYIAAITLIFLPPVLILFRSFITHNRQRNIRYDMQQVLSCVTEIDVAVAETPEEKKHAPRTKRVTDALFWGVLAVYVLYIAVFQLL